MGRWTDLRKVCGAATFCICWSFEGSVNPRIETPVNPCTPGKQNDLLSTKHQAPFSNSKDHTGPCPWFGNDSTTPSTTACSHLCLLAPVPADHTGPCRWFRNNSNTTSIRACSYLCLLPPVPADHTGPCRWFLDDCVTQVSNMFAHTCVCWLPTPADHTGPCRWFLNDGVTFSQRQARSHLCLLLPSLQTTPAPAAGTATTA